MAVANFEELCKGFCEVAGTECPGMDPTPEGGIAIAIELNDVKVILSSEAGRPGRVLLLAVLGALPPGREAEACRAALQLNSQVHTLGFAFARNPATQEIVLKQELFLDGTTPVEMYRRVLTVIEGSHSWRTHHFIFDDNTQES